MKILLVILGLLTAFAPMSTDMYLPAFSAIARDLQVSMSGVQVTLATFFVGSALGQVVYGPLSDRYGRKSPLYAGLALYIVGSWACALAPNIEVLVAARLVQAFGASAGIVIARAIVSDLFNYADGAWALSRMMLVMGVAPILAPLIGGQLSAWLGWRSIFWLLSAFGVLCLILCMRVLQESHTTEKRLVANWASRFAGFTELLRHPGFLGHTMVGALAMSAMFVYIAGSPFVFIELYGVPATRFGYLFGLNAVALIAGSQLNAVLLKRMAPGAILRWSLFTLMASTITLLVTSTVNKDHIAWLLLPLFLAIGSLGLVMPNTTALAMREQRARAGVASALLGSLQFFMFGVAAAAVSVLHNGTSLPMAGTMALYGLCAWLLYRRMCRDKGTLVQEEVFSHPAS